MKIVERAKAILDSSESFLLSTNDRNGFPNTIVVSKPIIRASFHNFKFYIDGDGETAKNIQNNSRGNICCFTESDRESLVLKGMFSIESIENFRLVENKLSEYQQSLGHKNPAILSFEVYTLKVHSGGQTDNHEL